jgi:hypothetical protein
MQYDITDAKTGQVLSTVWGWTEAVDGEPHQVATVSHTTFSRGGDWRLRAVFTDDQPPRCLSWETVVHRHDGSVLVESHTRWAPEIFPLLTEPFPQDTYPIEAPLGYVFTRLHLGLQPRASFHTVFGGTLAQIDTWVDGRETLQVPGGTFEAYRIHIRANAQSLFPNLPGFLRPVLSFFIPTYTAWLTTAEPQLFIKFVGQMGPPGSPELVVRLLQVRQPPAP